MWTANGTEAGDYGPSAPLQGTLNGQPLVVNFHGRGSIRETAKNGTLTILQGLASNVTATATLGGIPQVAAVTPVQPGSTFSYSCGASNARFSAPGTQIIYVRS